MKNSIKKSVRDFQKNQIKPTEAKNIKGGNIGTEDVFVG